MASFDISRRSLLAGALLAPQAAARRPNILLIVADDHGWNDLGCYGHAVVKTPSLDRLAGDGVRFTECFTTAPLCSPGRGAVMTGLYPHKSGVTRLVQGDEADGVSMDPGLWTLARGLGSLGYETAAARKWHLSTAGPRAHGFEHEFAAAESYLDQSVEFVKRRREQPFFLYFCPTHTHRPFRRHEDFAYQPDEVKDALPPYLKDTALVREHYARYLSETSKMDQEIGALLAAIDLDRTVVVYCTDHGPSMHRAKFSLYDWGTRSSLIFRGPGCDSGLVDEGLASTIDIPSTLLALAGGEAPASCQGLDLSSRLRGGSGGSRRYVHSEHHERNELRAVRDERYKLIRNVTRDEPLIWPDVIKNWQGMGEDALREPYPLPRPAEELYDLREDPLETRNLAGEAGQKATLARLRSELERWWSA